MLDTLAEGLEDVCFQPPTAATLHQICSYCWRHTSFSGGTLHSEHALIPFLPDIRLLGRVLQHPGLLSLRYHAVCPCLQASQRWRTRLWDSTSSRKGSCWRLIRQGQSDDRCKPFDLVNTKVYNVRSTLVALHSIYWLEDIS